MSYDTKFVKLINGDSVMGQYDSENEKLINLAVIQAIPTGTGGMQIALLPFGFPYEEEFGGEIDMKHVIYEYQKIPEELQSRYVEAKSNIRIASNVDGIDPKKAGGGESGSGIIF